MRTSRLSWEKASERWERFFLKRARPWASTTSTRTCCLTFSSVSLNECRGTFIRWPGLKFLSQSSRLTERGDQAAVSACQTGLGRPFVSSPRYQWLPSSWLPKIVNGENPAAPIRRQYSAILALARLCNCSRSARLWFSPRKRKKVDLTVLYSHRDHPFHQGNYHRTHPP